MKYAIAAIALVTIAQGAYAENSYEYTGARLPAAAKQAQSAVPAPTAWTPPHLRPHYTVSRPVLHVNASAGPVAQFSTPTFSTPTFSTPTYSAPTNNMRTGFSAPTFSAPTYSAPTSNVQAGFNQPTFNSPTYAAPTFNSGVR